MEKQIALWVVFLIIAIAIAVDSYCEWKEAERELNDLYNDDEWRK